MSAAMDRARSMMAAFRRGWESTGEPITREALRVHAVFMTGIQREILAEHPEWMGASAEMEAYEQIAREYAADGAPLDLQAIGAEAIAEYAPDDDGTEAEALAPVEVPRSLLAPAADAEYSTAGVPVVELAPIADLRPRWSQAGVMSVRGGAA